MQIDDTVSKIISRVPMMNQFAFSCLLLVNNGPNCIISATCTSAALSSPSSSPSAIVMTVVVLQECEEPLDQGGQLCKECCRDSYCNIQGCGHTGIVKSDTCIRVYFIYTIPSFRYRDNSVHLYIFMSPLPFG